MFVSLNRESAAVMAAVSAFELTGDANALLPLLAAAAVAYVSGGGHCRIAT
ncbi:hypothetical protein [Paraburkholderia gardini]|uniref:hypothetical protein n=1 Tax=Paraburkholderia gardini TaxID=2823469 RepID=UPI001E3A3F8C|nr:hypothetical protein [Paraburkholderia gardini]